MEESSKRVVISGAGGAPSEGVIFSLLQNSNWEVVGFGSDPSDLIASQATIKSLVPFSNTAGYKDALLGELRRVGPSLIHFQNDLEILIASGFRDDILELGVNLFMPEHSVIEICTNKWASYQKFKQSGIVVPENFLINDTKDLRRSFADLGNETGHIWIRDSTVGGGGKGSLSTNNYDFAKAWIDNSAGWGTYLASELLTADTMTWQSMWYEGQLVAGQSRKRYGWIHGNRSVSGVTGITKIGETTSRNDLVDIGTRAVLAVDDKPHGLYGVDFTLNVSGTPNPTEINISRFFTTIRFFTEAGFNFPNEFMKLAFGDLAICQDPILNPLPEGLMWLRGMDRSPLLMEKNSFESAFTR
jgi:hypothetical protein